MSLIKRHLCLVVVLTLLLIGRLMLLGKGFLDDTDELPFLSLLENFEALLKGSANAWNLQVIGLWSTYPETAIRLIETIFLRIYADLKDIPESSTEALAVMGVFNIIFSLLIALYYYKILLRLDFSRNIAALGVLLFGTLLNTNLYIRHILAYDSSLLFHMVGVYFILSKPTSKKSIILAGMFCALGFFTYFGNFTFIFITWVLLMLQTGSNYRSVFSNTFILALPSVLFLLFFEWVSHLSGLSFIKNTLIYSGTIYHGSAEEGLAYIFKYFNLVENWWGNMLLAFFFIGLFMAIIHYRSLPKKLNQFLFVGIITYLLYGCYAVLTGQMVFYGRVLHMYYPFVIAGVLILFERQKRLAWPIAIAASIHFIFIIQELNSIGYPRSMVFERHLFDKTEKTRFENELRGAIIYNYKMKYFHEEDWDLTTYRLPVPKKFNVPKDSLILLNFSFFYHYPDNFMDSYKQYIPPKNAVLLEERTHFMCHPAYTFEYYTKNGREFMLKKNLKIKIYKLTGKSS